MTVRTEKTPYGYKSVYGETSSLDEAKRWLEEVKGIIGPTKRPFCQMIDIRGQKVHDPDVQGFIVEAMGYLRQTGLQRSAIILSSPLAKMEITRLAKESGVYAYERYFDASKNGDWEKAALDWLEHGVDPDRA